MIWTDQTMDQLRALWAEKHSTAEIGRRMGASRNAIIGKAHRMGLDSRPSPLIRNGETKPPPPQEMIDQARAMFSEGQSLDKVRAATGLSSGQLYKIRVKMLPPSPKITLPPLVASAVQEQTPPILLTMAPVRTPGARQCEWLDGHGRPWVRCEDGATHKGYCAHHAARVFVRRNAA